MAITSVGKSEEMWVVGYEEREGDWSKLVGMKENFIDGVVVEWWLRSTMTSWPESCSMILGEAANCPMEKFMLQEKTVQRAVLLYGMNWPRYPRWRLHRG